MKAVASNYEVVPLSAVRPHPRNPRRGDVDMIEESIGAVGFYGALLVQRSTGYIVVGEHRWRGAQRHNAAQVPVFWIDVDDETALRILLADNRTSDLAGYDDGALAGVLESFLGRFDGTGYTADDLDDILARLGPATLPPGDPGGHAPVEDRDRPGNTRQAQGLRDVVLMFQLDNWREYLELLASLRRAWGVTPAADVVMRALREADSAA